MRFEDVIAYMKDDGWPVKPLGEGTFRSGFRGEGRTFPFFVHVEGAYLVIAAVPYLRIPFDEHQAERLMVRLLELNREMNFAKFSVDDDGDVVLSVEYPIAELDLTELRDALDALTFYADLHWPEIRKLGSESQGGGG
jgi:hypothetical protein